MWNSVAAHSDIHELCSSSEHVYPLIIACVFVSRIVYMIWIYLDVYVVTDVGVLGPKE